MMGIFLACLTLAVLALILAPPTFALWRWRRALEARPFPLAVIGASLILLSFLLLPWLSLEPLRVMGFDWLSRLIPVARPVIEWLEDGRLRPLGVFLGPINFLTRWRGWMALLFTGNLSIVVLIPFLATLAIVLGHWVTWLRPRKAPAAILIASAGLSLFLMLFNLPRLDGLGERGFPHLMTVMLPMLGAHIHPAGPVTMALGLALLAAGGVQALAGADRRDVEIEEPL
jgi:hypothetical protein